MRLVVVSNRLPFTVSFEEGKEGKPRFTSSSGGLTTGLWSYLEHLKTEEKNKLEFLWVGWPGADVPKEREATVREYGEAFNACPVFMSGERIESFYHGFCNYTLWPLFHYFTTLAKFEEKQWVEYREVNQVFADTLLPILRPDDLVWIQDYHLMLLPKMIREKFPNMAIGFFLHIPFPSFEVFRLLPRKWREEMLEGLLGSGLIGFHTHDYTRDFLTSVLRTCGYEHHLGELTLRDRVVKVDTFPMGIDFERFAQAASSAETEARTKELRAKCGTNKIIFSVDRLDYTKGLINRLRGYDEFLKRHPEWRGKVQFIVSVAPSRVGVSSYQQMKQELEETVGRIVGTYGTVDWTPLVYQFRNLSFEEIVPLYRLCDVALITPLRDGMNLVAKEFIASRPDQTGVLILSEMAGAAKEMGEAVLLNPFHVEEFSNAIEQALTMPVEEQIRRNKFLQDRLRRYDVNRWADDFVHEMLAIQKTAEARSSRFLAGKALGMVREQYRTARRRQIFLDYDGTLVPFASSPRLARPDADLMELLGALATDPLSEVTIISGRTRRDLEDWFGKLPIGLVAEHGVWLRRKGGDWQLFKPPTTEWKEKVRPILQLFVDRLPGALLEEKEYSLAWHFRRADPEQAHVRAKELLDHLADFTRNIDVQVMEGKKVIEIRNTGINKGAAIQAWLAERDPDFVMGVGDDCTDEDLYRGLPPDACSICVGLRKTAARFFLGNYAAVRQVLRQLLAADREETPRVQPTGLRVQAEPEPALAAAQPGK